MVKPVSDEDILKLYFLCFILSGLRIYYFFGDDSTMLWRFFFKLLHLIFIIFCFLIWFWIYSLRPHQVLIQGCTFLQPVVIINNRYFFLWLFFILWSLKIRSWKNMTKIIKFLFFFILFCSPSMNLLTFSTINNRLTWRTIWISSLIQIHKRHLAYQILFWQVSIQLNLHNFYTSINQNGRGIFDNLFQNTIVRK